jgi:hypothetical protein
MSGAVGRRFLRRMAMRSLQARAGGVCLCLAIGMLAIGLWPFDFNPPNGAHRLSDGGGVAFADPEGPPRHAGGLVFTPFALRREHQVQLRRPGLGVDILLTAGTATSASRDHILTLYDAEYRDRIVIAQWKTHLLLRWHERGGSGTERWREIGVRDALPPGAQRRVAVDSAPEGSAILLDGQVVRQAAGLHLPAAGRDLQGLHLLLGNSWPVANGWSGRLLELVLHDQAGQVGGPSTVPGAPPDRRGELAEERPLARYAFTAGQGERIEDLSGNGNHLLLAARLPFRKPALARWELGERLSLSDLKDVAVNLLGFVPAGFFFVPWLAGVLRRPLSARGAALSAMIFGLALSLTIESVQAWLPTRDSCVRDVIFNTLGATLGWWLGRIVATKGGADVRCNQAVGGIAAGRT